jgi:hypothetical protein
MESVKDILMRRDYLSQTDAEDVIADFEAQLDDIMNRGGSLTEAEELVMDCFGLEPDYLIDFI